MAAEFFLNSHSLTIPATQMFGIILIFLLFKRVLETRSNRTCSSSIALCSQKPQLKYKYKASDQKRQMLQIRYQCTIAAGIWEVCCCPLKGVYEIIVQPICLLFIVKRFYLLISMYVTRNTGCVILHI